MASWRRVLQPVGAVHGSLVHSRRVRMLVAHFSDLIPARHSVLDVGCGDGLIDEMIALQRPDLQISGVDVQVRAGARVRVTPFDGLRLPFADRSWDTVMFCDVLHHTDDPIVLLREAARVARHGVVIKDHMVEGFLARPTLRLMDVAGNVPHGVRLTYKYLTAREWEEAVRVSGLREDLVRRDLGLYPSWADWMFGRSMHFIAVYGLGQGPPRENP
jgi:SAM-dependent methyltransferase